MSADTEQTQAEGLVDMFLDERLRHANEPPGVREAVAQNLGDHLQAIKERCGEQIGQLRSPASRRIPDAYFYDEEEAENALQTAAAGIRSASAIEGRISGDARALEAAYAPRLAPSARWATLAEASRVPRPTTRAQALDWSLTPIQWHEKEDSWPPKGASDLERTRQLMGTDANVVRVAERPYVGWVQLGLFERQRTFATRHPDVPGRRILIATGLDVADGPPTSEAFRLSEQQPYLWLASYDHLDPRFSGDEATCLDDFQGPLTAMATYRGQAVSPSPERGAGLDPFTLVPRIELAAHLGLRPEQRAVRHCLIDDQGPALVGRLWRGFLIHDGNYDPLEPAVHGADLIIRPDLYDRLEATLGHDRIKSGITVHHYESNSRNGDPDDD